MRERAIARSHRRCALQRSPLERDSRVVGFRSKPSKARPNPDKRAPVRPHRTVFMGLSRMVWNLRISRCTNLRGTRHVRIAESQDCRSVRRTGLRQEPGQEREGTQEGLHQAARPRRPAAAPSTAKIALQPIVDVAHLVHGPIACEGNSLGQPALGIVGLAALPHRLHHRHQRARRDLRRREAPVQASAKSSRSTIRPPSSSTRPASPR
jgi:hypothetical protein